LRDREVSINPGEVLHRAKGIEHCRVAEKEPHVVLIEPKSTLNTGKVRNQKTVEILDRIQAPGR
jgi:hypothetical protein